MGGEKILVQSRENRPGEAHRALISKFSLKIAEFFAVFFQNFANLPKFSQMLLNFRQISPVFSGFFQNAAFF